jgi:DNA-binding transcriptional MerR regulator
VPATLLDREIVLDIALGFKVYDLRMRISELAGQAGVAASTVRYYERIGLLPSPVRTASGYRAYADDAAARLLFVTRAKRIGLTLEQIAELLAVWDGVHCATAHEQIVQLVAMKRVEVVEQIAELQRFIGQLEEISDTLQKAPPPTTCLPDLSCCVPDTGGAPVTEMIGMPTRRRPSSVA